MELKLELVAEDLQFPEGPVALADGSVLFTEIRRGTLSRVRPGGRRETVAELGGGGTEHLAVPDLVCTNICFGGADMQDAWITASSTGRLYKTRWPRPGLRLNYNA